METLSIFTVCLAFLVDSTLYSVIVPIIPVYLETLNQTPRSMKLEEVIVNNDSSTVVCCADDLVNNTIPTSTHEDLKIGILFGSKTITQILFTFISGPIIDRIGCPIPMMAGISIIIVSTIVFAFGESYIVLVLARSIQGLGSAFLNPSVYSQLANEYNGEQKILFRVQGLAMACLFLGIVTGPPMGGVLYQFAGKEVPFLVLAFVAIFDLGLMAFVFIHNNPHPILTSHVVVEGEQHSNGIAIYRFLYDPFLVVCLTSVFIANLSMAFLEPTIAKWMKATMHSSEWEIGIIWFPAFIPHLLGIFATVYLIQEHSTCLWLVFLAGNTLVGLSALSIPLCGYYWVIAAPVMVIALGISMIDTVVMPTLAFLAETCYSSHYGQIYSFHSIVSSLCYGIGPILAGWIVETIGFRWMTVIVCLANISFGPFVIVLKKLKISDVSGESDKENISIKPDEPSYGVYENTSIMNDTGSD